jgi:hypothetical protein
MKYIHTEWNILKAINMVMEIINNLGFQSMPGSLTLTVAIINLSFFYNQQHCLWLKFFPDH